jgi:hypothetical protein
MLVTSAISAASSQPPQPTAHCLLFTFDTACTGRYNLIETGNDASRVLVECLSPRDTYRDADGRFYPRIGGAEWLMPKDKK